MRKDVEDGGLHLGRLRVAQLDRRELFQMVMQQPGMVDDRLQDECLAAGNRGAMAAVHRAGSELRAGSDIGRVRTNREVAGPASVARAPAQRRGGFETRSYIRGTPVAVLRAHARGHASPRTGGKQAAQPLAELAAIIFAHAIIAYRVAQRGEPRLEGGAAPRRSEDCPPAL